MSQARLRRLTAALTSGSAGQDLDDGVFATLRGSPPAVRALLVGVFLNRLGRFFQVYLVLFLTERGFTQVEAGVALGGYGAGTIAGVLVGGALADRLGARRCTLVSMLGTAGLIPAVQYLHHFPTLLAVVVLVGVVTQVFRPAASALLAELTPRHRRVMIFSLYQLAFSVGNASAPLIGAGLVAVSYDLLFWVEALACAAFAAVAAVALPRRAAGAAGEAGATPAAGRSGYAAILADRRYLLFLLALFLNMAVYLQCVAILPLAMRDAGLATGWYGAMFALNGLIVITGQLPVTKVVQRWPATRVVTIGFLLLAAGHALYRLPYGVGIFVAGTLIWSLAEIIGGPTVAAYPSLAAPDRLRGRYQGAAHAAFGLGAAVGPIAGVALWHGLGPTTWVVSALTSLVALAAARAGMRHPRAAPLDRHPIRDLDEAEENREPVRDHR